MGRIEPIEAARMALELRRFFPQSVADDAVVGLVEKSVEYLRSPDADPTASMRNCVDLIRAGYELNLTVIGQDPGF